MPPQPPLRLGDHSPLPLASRPLLPRQGPKFFLRGVLVSEETEGKDRQSGKLRHGGRGQGSEPRNPGLESEGGLGPLECLVTGGAGTMKARGKAQEVCRGPGHSRIHWLALLVEQACTVLGRDCTVFTRSQKGSENQTGTKSIVGETSIARVG